MPPRLFSTFPRGVAGTGLLLLRLTIGSIAALQGRAYFVSFRVGFDGMWPWAAIAVLLSLALLAGILTRPAAILTAIGAAAIQVSWIPEPHSASLDNLLATVLIVAVCIAVALIGPGAFSLDARLFGFRQIIIPRSPERPPRDQGGDAR